MKRILLFGLLACSLSCREKATDVDRQTSFTKELALLRSYFHIPGMAAIVMRDDSILYERYFGFADLEYELPMEYTTEIQMASLTKMFSAVLVLKAAQGNDLLNEPINKYVSEKSIPDSIQVRHVLSHTSQGEVGQNFYYSNRFSWLTNVIEKKYGTTFDSAVVQNILRPLGLRDTYLPKDSTQLRNLAKPYFYEGETKPGFVDYGFSASAGITSTVRDIARFGYELNKGANDEMFVARDRDGKYGYGIFVQEFEGNEILWAYGQYDCYSSLIIKVRNITCVMAANNNLISDPARLIYGDVMNSLFALTFMEHFVIDSISRDFYLKRLKAQAVEESFMGRYRPERAETSKTLLRELFQRFPTQEYADLTTMHNIVFLKEIANQGEEKDFTEFDTQAKKVGEVLLAVDINNPYANYYLGRLHELNENDSARVYYSRVVNAKNFDVNWYTREAQDWLKNHP